MGITGATAPYIQSAMSRALREGELFRGATSPNPPVGAVGLDASGRILSIQAHQKAGAPHAETLVIEDCRKSGVLSELHTLIVTLEPCNHQGKTPPCTGAILETRIQKVIYGVDDPNPTVVGGGAQRLHERGIEVLRFDPEGECAKLISPFSHWARTGIPWITVKRAFTQEGSMIPPKGVTTFTSAASLEFAHLLRKRADAILTGSGTVLADLPEMTVRLVPDHPRKKRWLAVLDRRRRIPLNWVEREKDLGFSVISDLELHSALQFLGSQGAIEVLVEAGPCLSEAILSQGIWNQDIVIRQGTPEGTPDTIEIRENVHWDHSKIR